MKLARLNTSKFCTYVSEAGASILHPTNPYEVLRFRCKEGVGIVYRNSRNEITLTGAAVTAFEFFSRGRRWVAGKAYREWERPEVVERLRGRDGELCFYCGQSLGEDVTVEHLLAVTHGGPSCDANLCLVHEMCNSAAGSLPLVEKVRMFFERKGLHLHHLATGSR